MSPRDTRVLIQDGVLVSGIVDKNIVGTSPGGVMHVTMNDIGADYARRFMNSIQVLVNNWLLTRGFTVGFCDTVSTLDTMQNIERVIKKATKDVKTLVFKGQNGECECAGDCTCDGLKLQPGKSLVATFEARVNGVLNESVGIAGGSAMKSLDERNNIVATVTAGSKGSAINISQIIACVGQQNVEGGRIPFGEYHPDPSCHRIMFLVIISNALHTMLYRF